MVEVIKKWDEWIEKWRNPLISLIELLWWPYYWSQWDNTLPHVKKVMEGLRKLGDIHTPDINLVDEFLWKYSLSDELKGKAKSLIMGAIWQVQETDAQNAVHEGVRDVLK